MNRQVVERRAVAPVPEFEDDILQELGNPSADVVAAVDLLLEELETRDPDVDERCGLLDFRYELYAMRIGTARRHRLAVAIDRADRRSSGGRDRCIVFGLVPVRPDACIDAMRRTTRHLKLVNPRWEPS